MNFYGPQDPETTPDDIKPRTSGLPSATAGCCFDRYEDAGPHPQTRELMQYDQSQRQLKRHGNAWKSVLTVHCASSKVIVTTRFSLRNKSLETPRYPGTTHMSDDEIKTKARRFLRNAQTKWNTRKYAIKVIDEKCGEKTYRVEFRLEEPTSPNTPAHVNIDLVNANPGSRVYEPAPYNKMTIGRSYFVPSATSADLCKLNINDDVLAHEYAHVIGLLDEYYDTGMDRAGCRYTMPDGATVYGLPNRDTIRNQDVPAGVQFAREADILNSTAKRGGSPRHPRYCITIAMRTRYILNKNGHNVRHMEIL